MKKQNALINFPLWSIVSANVNHVYRRSFAKSKSAPIPYGIVQNLGHFDDPTLDPRSDEETCVTFVMSGEKERVDTTNLNVMTTVIGDELLTFVEVPP